MAYTAPVKDEEVLSSVRKFKKFFFVACALFVIIVTSMVLCPSFWKKNIIWSLGSFFTMFSIIANGYFDIRKTANPKSRLLEIENIRGPYKTMIKNWLNVEKIISFLWILGASLIVFSRWIDI